MSVRNEFGESNAPGPNPPAPPFSENNQQKPYQFTQEELKVFSECNSESFFQRSLPLGTLFGVAAFYGVKTGHFKPSVRWGPAPKVIMAAVTGYFLGKFSYQQKCAEKFMKLPNSRIGAILRQRKRGGMQENLESGSISLMPFSGASSSDTYSDVDTFGNPDIDSMRPDHEGLDDSQRPSLDNSMYEEETLPPHQNKSTTYDELRKKNRDDFQNKRANNYRELISQPSSQSEPDVEYSKPVPPKRTNKYGDTFD